MKKLIIFLFFMAVSALMLKGQVPQKFSYQAAIRNSDGTVMSVEEVDILIKLRSMATDGDVVYEEVHMAQTNAQGVVSIAVGEGNAPKGSFRDIPWAEGIFIEIGVKRRAESTFSVLGVSQILSVPYALQAGSLSKGSKEVTAGVDHNPEEPIFVVRNSNNEIVFAVYEDGVRVNVTGPEKSKSSRGGFAVGGLSGQNKADAPTYLTILPDMVEFNIMQPDPTDPIKSSRGGFAVGGLSGQNKSVTPFFKVNSDSTYVMNTLTATGNVIVTGDMLTGGNIGTLAISDREGNIYQTVKIGNQVWMKENLRTQVYQNGDPIPSNFVLFYNDVDLKVFGFLYTAEAINDIRGVCPTGWAVPQKVDWELLFNTLSGGSQWMENSVPIAEKLMENSELWIPSFITPNNSSGFSARPSGNAEFYSTWIFGGLGSVGYWWNKGSAEVIGYGISNSSGIMQIPKEYFQGEVGFSVRCVKLSNYTIGKTE